MTRWKTAKQCFKPPSCKAAFSFGGLLGVSAASVPEQALKDALQTQIDLGNLDRIRADGKWLDLGYADSYAGKAY
ncbi:hypothetical protein [Achromobacter insolitus]|uniref:hypothetical protein n=1 Tax=Achromobacter insolitus TaxID=217204 RepID=UPI001CD81446|nr:hypothetical protein [Achromobacter insolitus]